MLKTAFEAKGVSFELFNLSPEFEDCDHGEDKNMCFNLHILRDHVRKLLSSRNWSEGDARLLAHDAKEWVAYEKQLEEDRKECREVLKQHLEARGLGLRFDSKLCKDYIKEGSGGGDRSRHGRDELVAQPHRLSATTVAAERN
jgi:hypothetical protein